MNYLEKILSGRFIATVSISFTYCFIVCYATMKYVSSLASMPDKLESFVNGLVVGFSGLAVLIIKSYFDRQDRPATDTMREDSLKIIKVEQKEKLKPEATNV